MNDPYRLRRWVAGASLIAWPVLHFVGFITGPGGSEHTPELFRAEATRVQVSGLALHWSVMAIVPVVLALGHLLRARRPVFADIAVALGLIGAVSGASLLVGDFYDLALAHLVPDGQAVAVMDQAFSYPAMVYGFLLPGFLVHIGLLMLIIGLAVRRMIGWWVPVLVVAGLALPFALPEASVAVHSLGGTLIFAALAPLGVRILRMRPHEWTPMSPAAPQPVAERAPAPVA
ncbi:hypothetical protein [Luedemannella helvata]|uniref:DUF4386 family protein n=1 Tax=Luedemannella helvata TaxID=349315 RepID=A0ABP4X4S1_9ACTN